MFKDLPASHQAQSIQNEIEAFVATYVERYNDGDASGLAGLFTEDAVMVRPDNQKTTGSKGIEGYYRQFYSMMDAKGQISVGEVIPLPGNFSYTTGPYSLEATIKANGQKVKMAGTYSALSKKINGEWKIARMLLMIPTPPQS